MIQRAAVVLRLTLTLAAVASAVWCGLLWTIGGVRIAIFTSEIRSTDPIRPLVFAAIVLSLRILVFRQESIWSDLTRAANAITPSAFRWILVIAVFGIGTLLGSAVAGGADQYGYLSQAELWLKGSLMMPQAAAKNFPWPDAQWTVSPLGYRPSIDGDSIVPTYAPGLPLLLALFKLIGGQCAMVLVAPLAAALLVSVTFSIGREAISAPVGAAAAWLVATSPVLLFMMMSPMSDLPAAAFWGLAVYGCLKGSRLGALVAGLCAAIAIAIRPNLAHIALVPAVWLLVQDTRVKTGLSRFHRAVLFSAPVAIAGLAIAALNQYLYGAATASGYGGLDSVFTTQYIKQNVVNYTWWLIQSQTPLALIGLAVVWTPKWVVTSHRFRMKGQALIGGMALAVAASYILYRSFEAWWYLRFLLPCWPAMSLGATRVLADASGTTLSRAAKIMLLIVGVYGVYFAYHKASFHLGRGDQRYVKVAKLVAGVTEPNSVVITLQHSGSLRYYGGRTTVRYDQLHDRWLDRAILWFTNRGVHPYILLDDWEHEIFKNKFASRNVFGRLASSKVLEYQDTTSTTLYDPLKTPMPSDYAHVVRALPRRDPLLACTAPSSTPARLVLADRFYADFGFNQPAVVGHHLTKALPTIHRRGSLERSRETDSTALPDAPRSTNRRRSGRFGCADR